MDDSNPEESDLSPVKSFLDHLEDLRWLLFKIILVLCISSVSCFAFAPKILLLLQLPLKWSGIEDPVHFLKNFTPGEPFTLVFSMAFYAGLVFATPVILFLVAMYLLPALTRKERRYVAPFFIAGTLFFLAGAAMCYFAILPPTLKISRQFSEWMNIDASFWTVDSYISFTVNFMLGMGLSFEFPLLIILLVQIGVLSHALLAKSRSYAIVIILFISAAVTPSSDVFTMMMMASPLLVMYEGCIWVAWWIERKRAREAAASRD